MNLDISGALHDLSRLADRMAELVEWHRLNLQERRRPFATSFDLDDHFAQEMLGLKDSFVLLDQTLHHALDSHELSVDTEQRAQWRRELRQLEARAFIIAQAAAL